MLQQIKVTGITNQQKQQNKKKKRKGNHLINKEN